MESSTAAAADHGIKKRTGRACLPCSAMKAKCIALPGRDECERCHLQNRKCTPRVSGPRKKRIAVVTTKRVAQLEQKLDDLATLLASARKTPSSNDEQSPNPGSRSRSPVPQISQDIDSPVSLQQGFQFHEIELREGLSSTLVSIDPPRFQKTPATTNSQPSTTWAALSHSPQALALDPDNSEAENLLDTFRTECVLYSPLIYIPPNKTARQVQQDTPFLWKVIVAITSSGTPARQSALCTKIMEEICTRLLLKSEKTLELLQGILLFTAWYVSPDVPSSKPSHASELNTH